MVSGNEFFPIGIPQGNRGEFPLPPEDVAIAASTRHHRLVSAAPQLVMPPHMEGYPQASRWFITLAPVSDTAARPTEENQIVMSATTPRSVTEVIPSAKQPSGFAFVYAPLPRVGESEKDYNVRLRGGTEHRIANRISGVPVRFEAATHGGSGDE